MTDLLHKNDELLQFKIHVRKSHLLPQCALQLVREDSVLSSDLLFTFLYPGSSIQNASE